MPPEPAFLVPLPVRKGTHGRQSRPQRNSCCVAPALSTCAESAHFANDKYWRDNRPLFRLRGELERIVADRTWRQTLAALEEKSGVFDTSRDAMQMAAQTRTEALNADNRAIPIGSIEAKATQFRQTLA